MPVGRVARAHVLTRFKPQKAPMLISYMIPSYHQPKESNISSYSILSRTFEWHPYGFPATSTVRQHLIRTAPGFRRRGAARAPWTWPQYLWQYSCEMVLRWYPRVFVGSMIHIVLHPHYMYIHIYIYISQIIVVFRTAAGCFRSPLWLLHKRNCGSV